MDETQYTAPVLDEQQIAAELDLSSMLASLADERLITAVLTKFARRSVMAQTNTNRAKPPFIVYGTSYPYQYSLEFPSGAPLLLVEVVADNVTSGNTFVIALNGQPFGASTTTLYSRPYLWVPPSTQIDIYATNAGVVAHATGLQLSL